MPGRFTLSRILDESAICFDELFSGALGAITINCLPNENSFLGVNIISGRRKEIGGRTCLAHIPEGKR